MADAHSTLMDLRSDPYRYAREWKEKTGGKVIGYFCCYAPEEMMHAAGALPVRITGENRVISKAGAHLQTYCCSLARTGLDMALTGDLGFLDGTVFTQTCDTMQRLSDIWRLNLEYAFHGDVVLPARFEGAAAEDYMRQELASFRRKLEEFLGPIDDDALRESIAVYNRNRELLAELYALRRADPGIMPCDESLWMVASSALMDKSEHNRLLEEVVKGLKQSNSSPQVGEDKGGGGSKVPLFAIGSVMDQWEFLRMLEQSGGTFIDDDLCSGRRYFEELAPDEADPVMGITKRLWDKTNCPCKHRRSRERVDCITERVGESGAKGAVFFQFKFCEPHAFDYPHIKKALDGMGIPSLEMEIEQGSVSNEQLRTRVEALLEQLRA